MRFLKTRAWFIRYRTSIWFGVMLGVLCTNVYIIHQQSLLSKQILEKGRVNNNYLRCIALIHPEDRTPENVKACLKDASLPEKKEESAQPTAPSSSTGTVPQSQSNTQPKDTPTTSEPPEKPEEAKTGVVESLIKKVKEVL